MIRELQGLCIQDISAFEKNTMKIFLNGKEKILSSNISSLNDFIEIILSNKKGKIIELNGKVIKKVDRDKISLKDGDRIELIQFMGGG